MARIIGLCLENTPQQLQKLREAVAAGEDEALRQAANSFASSSANLNASHLTTCCREFEQRGEDRNLDDFATLLREVDYHYALGREGLVAEKDY